MAYLDKFARNKKEKEPTQMLTARLPQSVYAGFKDHCESRGLTVSEGIYLLVTKELDDVSSNVNTKEQQPDSNEEEKQHTGVIRKITRDSAMFTEVLNMRDQDIQRKSFEVDGVIPCPLCEKWIAASNFTKHAKRAHELSSLELLVSNKEKAVDMMIKRLNNEE